MEKECKDFGVRWLLSRVLDNLRERVNLNPQISTQSIVKPRAVYMTWLTTQVSYVKIKG